MQRYQYLFVSLFLIFFSVTLRAETAAQGELRRLGENYWQEKLRQNPMWATLVGDHQHDDRLDDLTALAREKSLESIKLFRERALAVDNALLPEDDRLTKEVLLEELDAEELRINHKLYQWRLDHLFGPQIRFAQLVNDMPLTSTKEVQNLIARFKDYPRYLKEYEDNLTQGLTEGRVSANIIAERVIKQIDAILLKSPESSPFGVKAKSMPSGLYELYGPNLIAAINESVYPGLSRFSEFLKNTYLPKTRDNAHIGLIYLTGGATAYQDLIRIHTTMPYNAEELHQNGLKDLENIHKEMLAIAAKMGHRGTLAEFENKIKKDPANFFQTRDEILSAAKRKLDQANAAAPKYFLSMPAVYCDVLAIEQYREKDAIAAFYHAPDDQTTRPGIFYVNTFNPASRLRYTMAALTIHEAVPGHHTQIATAITLKSLPAFRRHAGFTPFIEGWGLYSERLGGEMGLYENDLERFGMLTYQAWRASRLVVDTGIHAKGWSREKAIEFMKTNAPLSEEEIINEIDRYIVMPGQALAYKTGQREIESLRAQAQKSLGENFSLREFHYMVLKNGAIPLPQLRQIINRWITAKQEALHQETLRKERESKPSPEKKQKK